MSPCAEEHGVATTDGFPLSIGLDREGDFWEDSIHELQRMQEKVQHPQLRQAH
jgi:hypothetical protein